MRMPEADKELLHKQASDQAEKFEVLNKRDVASMSRVRFLPPDTPPSIADLFVTGAQGTR